MLIAPAASASCSGVASQVFRALAKGGGVKVVQTNLNNIGREEEVSDVPSPPLTETGLPRERLTKARWKALRDPFPLLPLFFLSLGTPF